VLSLADDYPRPVDRVDAELLDRAGAKKLRMLVEYPLAFPGRKLGEPRPTVWERVVTTSEFFAPNLGKESILAMHGCWFLPTKAGSAHLSLARLAGYLGGKELNATVDDAFARFYGRRKAGEGFSHVET